MKSIFILGDNYQLCKSELENYFAARGWKFEIVDESKNAVVAETEELKKEIIKDLGGTIKICEVLDEKTDLEKLKHPKISDKLFSVSAYNFPNNTKAQRGFAMRLKKASKGSKFFQGKSPQISAVEILKKDLLEKDFVLLNTEKKIYLAKTIAVYNPFDFKKRDMERPFQRPLQGMPIRIAKILLNLARVTEKSKVLDPFCGYGAIPQEVCSMGAEVIGIDIDDLAIDSSKGNIDWFQSEYKIKCRYAFLPLDVMQMGTAFEEESFDAIVTEPSLGPPLKKVSEDDAFQIIEELEGFYLQALPQISRVLKKNSRLSIILPKIKAENRKFFEMNLKHILPSNLKKILEFEDARVNQTTIRKIYVFEKV
ncbi:MAG TPA: methyltransferase domain-containing protein [archaeon]|nr:methyltransferase domain-containing protein [archaeon]